MQDTSRYSACSYRDPRGFYESLVLKALQGMRKGRLLVDLPDGRTLLLGDEPEGLKAHMVIRDSSFFRRCFLFGDVGFGEAYESGEWDTDDLVAVLSWMILNADDNPSMSGSRRSSPMVGVLRFANRIRHLVRDNTRLGSRRNITAHYDLSNDFFRLFLDDSMTYSSADFETGQETLEGAQVQKYDRLCKTLRLKPSDHLLEIGTGWGSFAVHAAKSYGCRVTTATISREQYTWASERIRREGLENQIGIVLSDYRDLAGNYDKIASIEMLEAVGARHLKTFFEVCGRLLKKNGLMCLQVILSADGRFDEIKKSVDWIQKYIFPGSVIPSLAALHEAAKGAGDLNLYALHDLGRSYARTLNEWRRRFNANLDRVTGLGFDEKFRRRWQYYLSYCEAAFSMRHITVGQLLYSRPNNLDAI